MLSLTVVCLLQLYYNPKTANFCTAPVHVTHGSLAHAAHAAHAQLSFGSFCSRPGLA
jgi:hypothetical protein